MRGHELGGNDTLAMSLRKAFATCKNGTLPKLLGRMEDFCISGPWALLCRSRVEPPPEVRAHKGQAPEPGWGLRFYRVRSPDFDLKYLRFRLQGLQGSGFWICFLIRQPIFRSSFGVGDYNLSMSACRHSRDPRGL